MNKEQQKKGEQVASSILRVLAVVGFVAIVALATWLFVQAIDGVPFVRENLRAAVTSMTSVMEKAPEESLTFNTDSETLGVNEATTVSWKYTGEEQPSMYSFSYTCKTDVQVSAFLDGGWTDIVCAEPVLIENPNITVIAENEKTRLSDVTFTVEAHDLFDTIVLSVVNTEIPGNFTDTATSDTEDTTKDDEETDTSQETTGITQDTTTSKPATPITPVAQPIERRVSIYNGPADLVVAIKETGVLVDVEGEDTFFPVSPIPSNKVAGVVFTVTNKGGETSEAWEFTAELPIEGDDTYEYNSPLQIPLASGMQITFTLGFDEVLEENEGRISIELDPRDSGDKKSNNTASVNIRIAD